MNGSPLSLTGTVSGVIVEPKNADPGKYKTSKSLVISCGGI